MIRNIDPALLRAFVTVAEAGGMTAAAKLLNLTQAAVSQQIKRLEDMFDSPLFDRDGRSLIMTNAGEQLLPKARRLLELNDELWHLMVTTAFEGEVRLGVPHDIVAPFIPSILRQFGRSWPKVRVSLTTGTSPNLLKMLSDGDIDLTLTTELQPGKGSEILKEEPLVWAGALDGRAHLQEPRPIALGDKTCAFRMVALNALEKSGLEWRNVCETSNMESLLAIVDADLGVVPLLTSSVPDGFHVLSGADGMPELPLFSIALYGPPGGYSDLGAELAAHIRRGFAAHLHGERLKQVV